jgi:surface antigen
MKWSLVVLAFALSACCSVRLCAETWYLPDGKTMTTSAGSTPPVSGATLYPHSNVDYGMKAAYPLIICPAPSFSQIVELLPKLDPPQDQPLATGSQVKDDSIETTKAFKDALLGQHGGQCAAFVQHARPELSGFGHGNKMPAKALAMGFEVNGIPRVGSVLSIEKAGGSEYGHAGIVTSVLKDGKRYLLTIKDSNANEDELISSRSVYYMPSENGVFGNYGKYEEMFPGSTRLAKELVVVGFIHEKLPSAAK